jgi:hypothetical protein
VERAIRIQPHKTLDTMTGQRRDIRLLLISALASGACLALALWIVTLGFESNDDVGMAEIVSGLTTGAPSAELIFSNILIGSVLKFLYGLTDRVNWYTLYLLGAHFVALTGLLWAFLRLQPSRKAVILFALLFVEFEVALLLRLQFTSTAILAAVGGLVLLLSRDETSGRRSSLATGWGAALLIMAGLIRPDGMYYAIVLLVPLFAYEALCFRRWRPFVAIGLSIIVVAMAAACDGWHYRSDPAWREFMAYNRARASIHDLPIVTYEPNTRFFFNRVGWSYTDFGMFTNWFFSDRETFSRERLEAILKLFEGSEWSRAKSPQYLADSLRPLSVFPPLVYANLLLAIVLAAGSRLRMLLVVAGAYVLLDSLLVVFSWYAKLPARIVLPAYLSVVVMAFYVVLREASLRRHLMPLAYDFAWLRPLTAVAAVAFAAYYALAFFPVAVSQISKSDLNQRDQQVLALFVRTLRERYVRPDPQAIFLNWGGRFPMFFTAPWDNYREIRKLRMLGLGWNIHSPQYDAAVSRLGLGDLYRASYTNPNVFLFSEPASLQQLQRFVQEHYRQPIVVKRADHLLADSDRPPDYFATDFSVYQMAPKCETAGATETAAHRVASRVASPSATAAKRPRSQ